MHLEVRSTMAEVHGAQCEHPDNGRSLMSESPGWQKLFDGKSMRIPSLDDVREKLTRGVELRVDHPAVRRGGCIEAVITIGGLEGLGELEVGLVCTEHYDVRVSNTNGGCSRSTSTATEHHGWQPVQSVRGEHAVRLSVPPSVPFSYQGSCLSFSWEIVARGRKERALDSRASQSISVQP